MVAVEVLYLWPSWVCIEAQELDLVKTGSGNSRFSSLLNFGSRKTTKLHNQISRNRRPTNSVFKKLACNKPVSLQRCHLYSLKHCSTRKSKVPQCMGKYNMPLLKSDGLTGLLLGMLGCKFQFVGAYGRLRIQAYGNAEGVFGFASWICDRVGQLGYENHNLLCCVLSGRVRFIHES